MSHQTDESADTHTLLLACWPHTPVLRAGGGVIVQEAM